MYKYKYNNISIYTHTRSINIICLCNLEIFLSFFAKEPVPYFGTSSRFF